MQHINYNFFTIERSEELTPSDNDNMLKFYLPILGAQAVTLYNYLYSKIKEDKYYHSEFTFSGLCAFLKLDEVQLSESRNKLEAIGLIQTFFNSQTNKLMFVIKRPLNKEEVKNNRLLKNALVECLGKDIVDSLLNANVFKSVIKPEYVQNISANFFDVFGALPAISKPKTIDLVIEAGKRIEESVKNGSFAKNTIELKTPIHFLNSDIQNEYQALQSYEPIQFFKYLNNNHILIDQIQTLKEYERLGFDYKVINFALLISYFASKEISLKQTSSILKELKSKNILSFELAENYLDGKYSNHKIYRKSIESKNYVKRIYLNSL